MEGECKYRGKKEEVSWSEGTIAILIIVAIIQMYTGLKIRRVVHQQKKSISP